MVTHTDPILSIVTLAFNQRRFIHRALASVPIDPRIEHIVVDPGSSDGTTEYLKQEWSSSKTLLFSPDSGPAEGLNNGFSASRGRFGFFLNGDDFMLPGSVFDMIDAVLSYNSFDVILGGGYVLDLNTRWARELIMPPFNIRALKWDAFPFFQQGMVFKLDAYRRVGGFNILNRTHWDGELLIDLVISGATVCTVATKCGVFVIHDASISGTGRLFDAYVVDSARSRAKLSNPQEYKNNNRIRKLAPLTRRLYAWQWALADIRDRLIPSYTFKKVMAVYNSLAETPESTAI